MITTEKMKLLNAWKQDLFEEQSISEIMKASEKNTKTWVFNSLKQLKKENMLKQKKKGNINLYSLNLDNPRLIETLQFMEIQKSISDQALDIITETIKKIHLNTYCLLIFGSFAENKQKKSSDIDICFLIKDKDDEKKIKPYFKDVKLNFPIDIDEHYITFDDFKEMLIREEENLAKQIFRKHRIFFNHNIYYKLIKEAYKNGFRP